MIHPFPQPNECYAIIPSEGVALNVILFSHKKQMQTNARSPSHRRRYSLCRAKPSPMAIRRTEHVYPLSKLVTPIERKAVRMLIKTIRVLRINRFEKRSLCNYGIQVCCVASEATNGSLYGKKDGINQTENKPHP